MPRLRIAAAARVAIGVLIVVAIVVGAQAFRSAHRSAGNDFTSYLLSASALARGESPYGLPTPFPYVYPLTLALLLIPLTLVPYGAAVVAWFVASAASLVAACRGVLAVARVPPARAVVPLAIAALLLLDVLQSNLRNGQVNFVVLALAVWGCRWLVAGRQVAAGVCLGFAISIKLLPWILLGYAFMRRQFVAIGVALATVALALLAPYPLLGDRWWPVTLEYERTFVFQALDEIAVARPDLLDFRLARFVGLLLPASLGAFPGLALAAAIVVAGLLAVDLARFAPPAASRREAALISLYLLAIPLLSPLSEVHHLAFALPAVALQAVRLGTAPAQPRDWALAGAGLAAYFYGQVRVSGAGYFVALMLLAVATLRQGRAAEPAPGAPASDPA
jgi:alpha-1,2-mannosyltransferase